MMSARLDRLPERSPTMTRMCRWRSPRLPRLEDGAGNLVYTFTRAGVTTGELTANFTISGTATFNTDYTQTGAATFTPPNGTVVFARRQFDGDSDGRSDGGYNGRA